MLRTIVFCCFLFVFYSLCNTVSGLAQDRSIPKDFQERLHQDWILQDAGRNVRCFTDSAENTVEIDMLEKVLTELDHNAQPFRDELKKLQNENTPGNNPVWKELYWKACAERRRKRLQIVREKYPVIVYAKHQVLGGSHYAYTEAPSDAQVPEQRDMLGGKILSFQIQPDGSVAENLLVEAPQGGTLRDPAISFDGRKIVFSMRNNYKTDDYHLYDYDVETKKIRQLTFGVGFADVEPCYLPDGNILFCSTRCMQIVDCWWTDATNLYLCDSDGRFLRRISFDQVHTNYPQVLNDGRIIYTRWDYNDRGQIYPQPLFVMNYDGTGQTEFYGNNSWFPTTILHARGIPDSNKVVAVASGHHTHQRGKLIVIDRTEGTQENQGVQLVAPPRETKADKIDVYGQGGDQFQYPLAIDENHFIVAYTPDGFPKHNHYDIPFGLYYMDIDNAKRELLAYDPAVSCGQPVPLQARQLPMLRATPVDYETKTGSYYVQDVYFGPGLEGVERGTIKELRIVALEFRPAGILQNGSAGPAGSALSSTPISINNGSWDVKRVLGTVPVAADGSAYFEVPARTPVFFQLLNAHGEAVQSMRSWSTLQPGEMFSCVGCHEEKGTTRNNPQSRGGAMRTLALRKSPQKPVPLNGVAAENGFSFERIIQPILDKHCVQCHTGIENETTTKISGNNKTPFSLLGNQFNEPKFNMAGRRFSESYINLTRKGQPNEIVYWLNVQSVPTMLPPYFAGSPKSKILRMFGEHAKAETEAYHKNVSLNDLERRQLALWIDLLVPFCGSYTEANNWNEAQKAEFDYYLSKRDRMAEIEQENITKFVSWRNGNSELPKPELFTQFESGGQSFKKQFIENRFVLRKNLPVIGKQHGTENVYRNLALNPSDVQGEAVSFPHASSNSEYAGLDCFAAKNVLDGRRENQGHGNQFPSWGPNKRTDLYLTIEFGRPVEIDKVIVWLRADFPHDNNWKTGTLKFSDGSNLDISFEKTAEPQTIPFPKRTVTSLTFTNLQQDFPLGWTGFTEIEVWGQDIHEQ
ncbi:MAG: hypothetical protein LBL62_02650 [Planctomycetaceae bacterium]|jgi:hypothetical protein|nr:hypothetical protein [Planctomycetaceae bacterium]